MSRNPVFYFGSIIFFVGFLLIALAMSRLPNLGLDLLTIAEIISGVVLVIVGTRAVRSGKH